MLPIIAEEKLADYIDCFCERNYFTVAQMAEILEAGKSFGLIPKVHVNQFSILGGVQKAVELGALSVDHLEEIDAADITALQQSDCIATLLPGCSFFCQFLMVMPKNSWKTTLLLRSLLISILDQLRVVTC